MSLRSHGQPTPGVGAAALIGVPVMVLLLVVVHSERERDLSQRDVQRLVPDEATNRRDIEKSRQPPRSSPHRLGEQVTAPDIEQTTRATRSSMPFTPGSLGIPQIPPRQGSASTWMSQAISDRYPERSVPRSTRQKHQCIGWALSHRPQGR
jgi:hypothetical protein